MKRESNTENTGPVSGKGRLVIISAASGTGKTTLCNALLKRLPCLRYSVSYTTRSPRNGEIDGRDYHFISTREFTVGITNGRWAEWAEVHGNHYGTSAHDLNEWMAEGENVLLDIDVNGAMQILKKYPESISIFILPPSLSVLEERLRGRGTDSPAIIATRLENAKKEISARDQYDHVIINNEFDRAVDELESLIRSALPGLRTYDGSQGHA